MNGLTTEERKAIRENLLDLGFQRVSPSFVSSADPEKYRDKGDGVYTEEWQGPGNTHITLTWAAKKVNQPRHLQPDRLVTAQFLGQAGEFDLWHGIDDEDDDCVAVVMPNGHWTLYPRDSIDSLSRVSMDAEHQAALEAAVRVCWIEG